jgi:hypothetical protein
VVLSIFGVMLFVIAGLALLIFTNLRNYELQLRQQTPRANPVGKAGLTLLWSSLVVFLFLMYSVAASLVFGRPLDLRHYVNPKYIVREDWPRDKTGSRREPIALEKHLGTSLKTRQPLTQAPRPIGDRERRQLIWEEWLYTGASKGSGITVSN